MSLWLLDFEVDGGTVSAGLTDHMIAQLFEKSFKKQVKFIKLIQQLKENQSEELSESLTTPSALRQVLVFFYVPLYFLLIDWFSLSP